jgi:hypothetical protein
MNRTKEIIIILMIALGRNALDTFFFISELLNSEQSVEGAYPIFHEQSNVYLLLLLLLLDVRDLWMNSSPRLLVFCVRDNCALLKPSIYSMRT